MGSLFLVRHATTAASESGRNLGQASDPPLVPEGARLAARIGGAIAMELAELPHDATRIVSSPALRCRQTASAIAAEIGAEETSIEVEPGLLEIAYGGWEGLTPSECRERDPELRERWEADPFATRCPGGESGGDVAARAMPVFEQVEGWLGAERGRTAIVVAHNHVNRLRLCALLGLPMSEYRRRVGQDPGGYSLVTFGPSVSVLRRLNCLAPPEGGWARPPTG
ncbi:MAG TPA: histidine phosphatase family protein [Candidatus Limnocylindria bacterium]|nr:histidine phosphatase family protein [Candidatus Limnocylindria bacterium]